MFAVADRLGKTLGEIGAMPAAEFDQWIEFYKHIEVFKP
jgi:hypothetical protein